MSETNQTSKFELIYTYIYTYICIYKNNTQLFEWKTKYRLNILHPASIRPVKTSRGNLEDITKTSLVFGISSRVPQDSIPRQILTRKRHKDVEVHWQTVFPKEITSATGFWKLKAVWTKSQRKIPGIMLVSSADCRQFSFFLHLYKLYFMLGNTKYTCYNILTMQQIVHTN